MSPSIPGINFLKIRFRCTSSSSFDNCVCKVTPELLDEEIIKQIKIYASKSTGYFTEEKRYSLNIF